MLFDTVVLTCVVSTHPFLAIDEAETALLKKDREDRRQKRQMMASTVLKELRDEVSDRPMEIREQNESGVDNLRAREYGCLERVWVCLGVCVWLGG